MLRPRQLTFLLSFLCCSVELAVAQTLLDPGFLEFTASADHNAVDTNGQPAVVRYDFLLYAVGSSSPLRVVDLGKPVPDSAGTIRIALNTILVPAPAGGVAYEVRVAAIGSGGSSASSPSNTFAYQVPCTYTVSPTNRSIGSSGGSSTFAVTAPAGCGWSAISSTSWISITSGASGNGSGTVAFTAGANPTPSQRTGSLTIAGQSVSVIESGLPCSYSVSPTSQTVARAGGPVSYSVTAAAGCAWSASEQSSWLSIASGASGSGTGTVTFTVAPNTGTLSRSVSATIAGRTVTVSQPAMGTTPAAPTGFRIVR